MPAFPETGGSRDGKEQSKIRGNTSELLQFLPREGPQVPVM